MLELAGRMSMATGDVAILYADVNLGMGERALRPEEREVVAVA
jgi:hypothetical protein